MTGVQEFPVELPEDFDHDAKRARQKRRRDVMKNGRYRDGNGTQKAGKLVKTKEANQEIKAREGKRKGGIAGGSKSREV